MTIFVGSKNPVKINAVVQAASETWPSVDVVGVDVPSGVSPQPMTDEETRRGAYNRAVTALDDGLKESKYDMDESDSVHDVIAVGLEGGVFETEEKEMWITVWAVVVDLENNFFESNGSRFKVPEVVAARIRRGEEMGAATDAIAGGSNIKQQQGLIGVVTGNFIDRTEEYGNVAKVALGLWFGRNWEKELQRNTT